jgi:hypothetical protein
MKAKATAKIPRCLGKGLNCKIGPKTRSWCHFHEDMTSIARSLHSLTDRIKLLRAENPSVGSVELSELIELEARECRAHDELREKWPHLFKKKPRHRKRYAA